MEVRALCSMFELPLPLIDADVIRWGMETTLRTLPTPESSSPPEADDISLGLTFL